VGKYADLLVHDHNPLTDFKLLYGTGAMRLDEATNRVEWHRGLKYTIKDGVIFDTASCSATSATWSRQAGRKRSHPGGRAVNGSNGAR